LTSIVKDRTLKYNKYFKLLLFITAILFILVVGFNWLKNPYGIYNSPKIIGINSNKPEFGKYPLMAKAYAIRKIKPEAVVLGSSRADTGIDPTHPGWGYRPVYNLALRGGHMYQIFRYFQSANAIKQLKQVILSVDFFSFNAEFEEKIGFSEGRLSSPGNLNPLYGTDQLQALLSLDGLTSSVETVIHQHNGALYLENGRRLNEYTPDHVRTRFNENFRFYLETKGYYSTIMGNEFHFDYASSNISTFDYYRKLLQTSYADNIDLVIITSPCHVTQWEALAVANLWDKWEEWKRLIVTINIEEAEKAGKNPFPVWDFSTYNDITMEAIPSIDKTNTEMEWYWDASHYKKEVGDLVLNKVFGLTTENITLPDNFGVQLTPENIERQLGQIRKDRESYRMKHPGEVEIIQSIMDSLFGN
jgi:hypothetical protein